MCGLIVKRAQSSICIFLIVYVYIKYIVYVRVSFKKILYSDNINVYAGIV